MPEVDKNNIKSTSNQEAEVSSASRASSQTPEYLKKTPIDQPLITLQESVEQTPKRRRLSNRIQNLFFKLATHDNRRPSVVTVTFADKGSHTNLHGTSDDNKFYNEFLEWHNKYRKMHGVPTLKMRNKLMKFAAERAKYLAEKNISRLDIIEYGESVHLSRKGSESFTGEQVANTWYSQINNFDFDTSTPGKNSEAFTQMIWRSTKEIGIAIARNGDSTWIVAIYNPPGNYNERWKLNVPPVVDINKTRELQNVIFEAECLEEHNKYRQLHGCPRLKLNRDLCYEADMWARILSQTKKDLIRPENCPYGVNMLHAVSSTPLNGEQVVKIWYDENLKYDFEAAKFSPRTGHFTQLIWRDTTDLGVGYIIQEYKTFVVCYYHPAGNYPGEFRENVPAIGSRPSVADTHIQDDNKPLEVQVLNAHNKYRKLHGAPPLKRSDELSEISKEWAQSLAKREAMEHRPKSKYGENIFLAQGVPNVSGERVVKSWYDEVSLYNFDSPQFSSATGHFTQLVWVTTKKIGIGIAKRNDNTWVVCNYEPPGNYHGQFAENVLKAGSPMHVDLNAFLPFDKQCLNAHNKYRSLHGCPPVRLSDRLSHFAAEWANTLVVSKQLIRRPSNTFGENIFRGTGSESIFTGELVVKTWYDEISLFNFNDPKFSKETSHFTQVIWRNTAELGVHIKRDNDTTTVVVYYSPAGNIEGEFKENVPPKTS